MNACSCLVEMEVPVKTWMEVLNASVQRGILEPSVQEVYYLSLSRSLSVLSMKFYLYMHIDFYSISLSLRHQ